jgi:hypothetical protein
MKSATINFLDEASEEVQSAQRWYAARSSVAAQRFNDEMDAVLQRISDAPARWPLYAAGVRKCRMQRFP